MAEKAETRADSEMTKYGARATDMLISKWAKRLGPEIIPAASGAIDALTTALVRWNGPDAVVDKLNELAMSTMLHVAHNDAIVSGLLDSPASSSVAVIDDMISKLLHARAVRTSNKETAEALDRFAKILRAREATGTSTQ